MPSSSLPAFELLAPDPELVARIRQAIADGAGQAPAAAGPAPRWSRARPGADAARRPEVPVGRAGLESEDAAEERVGRLALELFRARRKG